MSSTDHIFEVQAQEDGQFAIFVNGVFIAAYAQEAEAVAHCERLKKAINHQVTDVRRGSG